jgi:hypothetical protein
LRKSCVKEQERCQHDHFPVAIGVQAESRNYADYGPSNGTENSKDDCRLDNAFVIVRIPRAVVVGLFERVGVVLELPRLCMATQEHKSAPGFRLSALDVVILAVGAVAAIALATIDWRRMSRCAQYPIDGTQSVPAPFDSGRGTVARSGDRPQRHGTGHNSGPLS